MAWVVDTTVVLDLITADPVHEWASTACLEAHLSDGHVMCPVRFVEIGPAFGGNAAAADAFLRALQILPSEKWEHVRCRMRAKRDVAVAMLETEKEGAYE